MDHISRIATFLEVVKQKSFIAAARELGMTGPAVSKQVQKLEDQLGVRLLQRTTRQVTLTEEGNIYSIKATKALEDLDEVENQIQDLKSCPTGNLKINAPMSFGKSFLTKPIVDFAKKYPQVKMEVNFDDLHIDMIAQGYDVIVRIGALQDSTLMARKLADCPLILCASKRFIQENGKPDSVQDLSKFPAIIYNKNDNIRVWQYEDENSNIKTANLNQVFSANNAEMMLEACLNDMGVAILPIFVVNEYLKSGEIIQLFPDYKTSPQRGIYAIFPQNRYLSSKVRMFVDNIVDYSKNFDW